MCKDFILQDDVLSTLDYSPGSWLETAWITFGDSEQTSNSHCNSKYVCVKGEKGNPNLI